MFCYVADLQDLSWSLGFQFPICLGVPHQELSTLQKDNLYLLLLILIANLRTLINDNLQVMSFVLLCTLYTNKEMGDRAIIYLLWVISQIYSFALYALHINFKNGLDESILNLVGFIFHVHSLH